MESRVVEGCTKSPKEPCGRVPDGRGTLSEKLKKSLEFAVLLDFYDKLVLCTENGEKGIFTVRKEY